jgi:hypothetical protein
MSSSILDHLIAALPEEQRASAQQALATELQKRDAQVQAELDRQVV